MGEATVTNVANHSQLSICLQRRMLTRPSSRAFDGRALPAPYITTGQQSYLSATVNFSEPMKTRLQQIEDKYKADKEYWQAANGELRHQVTEIRAWMKENAPETWLKYELWKLAKYIVCQECNACPCRCEGRQAENRGGGENEKPLEF